MTYPTFSVGEVLTANDMNAVQGWLIESGTLTNVGTGGFDVDFVFDDTKYFNYKLLLTITAASTTNRVWLRMLLNNTAAAAGLYYCGGIGGQYATDAVVYMQRSNNDNELNISNTTAASRRNMIVDIFSPNEAVATYFSGTYIDSASTWHYTFGGVHAVATAYNGIRIGTNSGTISGKYQLYGYKK